MWRKDQFSQITQNHRSGRCGVNIKNLHLGKPHWDCVPSMTNWNLKFIKIAPFTIAPPPPTKLNKIHMGFACSEL